MPILCCLLEAETEVSADCHMPKFWMVSRDSLGDFSGPALFRKWFIVGSTVTQHRMGHNELGDAWLLTISYDLKFREHLHSEGCLLPLCFSLFLNFHLETNCFIISEKRDQGESLSVMQLFQWSPCPVCSSVLGQRWAPRKQRLWCREHQSSNTGAAVPESQGEWKAVSQRLTCRNLGTVLLWLPWLVFLVPWVQEDEESTFAAEYAEQLPQLSGGF